ncbi:exportin-4 [Anaeramoeba ignava]|uniref:Exportin-4 n=1 Tax=Anaeramoeba ignava TaxID=1746090 RepID=A0A9Q0RFF3_ANAIG|nr:exportin-4 [Anaeramoeba ignava]
MEDFIKKLEESCQTFQELNIKPEERKENEEIIKNYLQMETRGFETYVNVLAGTSNDILIFYTLQAIRENFINQNMEFAFETKTDLIDILIIYLFENLKKISKKNQEQIICILSMVVKNMWFENRNYKMVSYDSFINDEPNSLINTNQPNTILREEYFLQISNCLNSNDLDLVQLGISMITGLINEFAPVVNSQTSFLHFKRNTQLRENFETQNLLDFLNIFLDFYFFKIANNLSSNSPEFVALFLKCIDLLILFASWGFIEKEQEIQYSEQLTNLNLLETLYQTQMKYCEKNQEISHHIFEYLYTIIPMPKKFFNEAKQVDFVGKILIWIFSMIEFETQEFPVSYNDISLILSNLTLEYRDLLLSHPSKLELPELIFRFCKFTLFLLESKNTLSDLDVFNDPIDQLIFGWINLIPNISHNSCDDPKTKKMDQIFVQYVQPFICVIYKAFINKIIFHKNITIYGNKSRNFLSPDKFIWEVDQLFTKNMKKFQQNYDPLFISLEDQTPKIGNFLSELFVSISIFGRIMIKESLDIFNTIISQITNSWDKIFEKDKNHLQNINMQIFWIYKFIGHLLFDSGEGEKCVIPEEIQTLDYDDPSLINLIELTLNIINKENDILQHEMGKDLIYSETSQIFVWFLDRFCKNYLIIDAPEMKNNRSMLFKIAHQFGQDSETGIQIVEFVFGKIFFNLTFFPTTAYEDLHRETLLFLRSLSFHKLLSQLLISINSFYQLIDLQNSGKLIPAFSHKLCKIFFESLCRMVSTQLNLSSSPDEDAIVVNGKREITENEKEFMEQVKKVFDSLIESLIKLIPEVDSQVAQLNKQEINLLITQLFYFLHLFRGLIQSVAFISQSDAIFDLFQETFDHLINLICSFPLDDSLVKLFFKLLRDLVVYQGLFLSEKNTFLLVVFITKAFQSCFIHSDNQNIFFTKKNNLHFQIILEILVELISLPQIQELEETQPENMEPNLSQLFQISFSILSTVIDLEFSQNFTVISNYFNFIQLIFQEYPQIMIQFPMKLHKFLLDSLRYGISISNNFISTICYECIEIIEEISNQTEKIQSISFSQIKHDYFFELLSLVLKELLSQSFSYSLFDQISDTFFVMVSSHLNQFELVVLEYLKSIETVQKRSGYESLFSHLISFVRSNLANGLEKRDEFRKKLIEFLESFNVLRLN